jgi:dihydrofolate reductase
MLAIIVAMDNNNLIGTNNSLPWHLPADLQYFKQTTLGKTVVMGRKTYQSIGKPLPNRKNVILTRDVNFSVDGCEIIHSLDELKNYKNDDVFIIGGSNLYTQTLALANKLYITKIDYEFKGDAYFPKIDNSWNLISNNKHLKDEKNLYNYDFQIFQR